MGGVVDIGGRTGGVALSKVTSRDEGGRPSQRWLKIGCLVTRLIQAHQAFLNKWLH